MSDKAGDILDAAERRIRDAGYGGFSFRDIASDVGIKSASVHYHFPTKDALAVAVAKRYRERFIAAVAREQEGGRSVVHAWREVFSRSLREDGRACLCGVLGVTLHDLTPDLEAEVRRFFEAGVRQLVDGGLTPLKAQAVLSLLEGAMLTASVLGDPQAFDRVTTLMIAGAPLEASP